MARFTLASVVLLLSLLVSGPTPASAKWQTLSGKAPVIIANGGNSGLYPDQTSGAYYDALSNSLPGVVISCNLQMAPSFFQASGYGICRTGLDLKISTDINSSPNGYLFNSTLVVDGKMTFGYFAVNIPFENLTNIAYATQSNDQRTPAFDGAYPILTPGQLRLIINASRSFQSTWWLNSEYNRFIEQNSKLNTTDFLIAAIQVLYPGYVSVTEINILEDIQSFAEGSPTKLIYKFLDTPATADASTNQSYTTLLQNLTYIKTLASGILVPKSYIWPIDQTTLYLSLPTTLVMDAHSVGLEVYAYDFQNDQVSNSYNYTFDPITEYLYFTGSFNFSVDGVFTDFPTTASEAISCYASNSRNYSVQNKAGILQKPKVISHNGNSGKYPAATVLAYASAIDAKVDYIDCIVQISKDSLPFCRPTPNLVDSTDVTSNSAIVQQYLTAYPDFNGGAKGIYTFDLTWDQINTLRAIAFSPNSGISRDKFYDGQFGIITLTEFLSIAKNHSMGALIDIQNAVYLRDAQNLAVVDTVVRVLSAAGYNSTDKVILQSEDSSALARLRDLNVTYPLMYEAIYTTNDPISLTAIDFVEIKKYASAVNLYARLVEPFDSNYFLRIPPIDAIALAHGQNLTTYFQLQKNEFTSFAFDLEADPTLELYSLVHDGVDGFVTDFPTTVENYLGNQCTGYELASSIVNFSVPLVVRGFLGNFTYEPAAPASAPAPALVVAEPPLTGLPATVAPAVAVAPVPASASHISLCFLLVAISVVLHGAVIVCL